MGACNSPYWSTIPIHGSATRKPVAYANRFQVIAANAGKGSAAVRALDAGNLLRELVLHHSAEQKERSDGRQDYSNRTAQPNKP